MTDSIAHLALIEEDDLLLDEAALDLAALDHPGIDLAPYAALLSAIRGRLGMLGSDARSSVDRASLLARVIGAEYGFEGDAETYDDPANADMICVIDRRRGLPVSLSILYVAAARRLGWTADALNTPGHVVVRIGADTMPVLIDPFRGGCAVAQDDRLKLFATAGADAPAPVQVTAMANREVLGRLLLNQATRAEQGGDTARALTLYARMTVFAPANANAWWQLARLELMRGQVSAARASLTALLEMTLDPELRQRVTATIGRLGAGEG